MSRTPSPAMAVALLALFLSLGGVSYGVATGSIDSRELKNNTVRGKDIRNNDLRTSDLRNNDVRGRDIRNGTIGSADVGANKLTGADINEAKLKVGAVDRAFVAAHVDSVSTAGLRRATPSAANDDPAVALAQAEEVPLFARGAFSVYGKCYRETDADRTLAGVFIRARVSGALFESEGGDELNGDPDFLNTTTAESSREVVTDSASGNAAAIDFDDATDFGATAPDGTTVSGRVGLAVKNGTLPGGQGMYGAGNTCLFWGHGVG